MGLDERQSHALFLPPVGMGAYEAEAPQAAAVIDHLIATGEVDWSVAKVVA